MVSLYCSGISAFDMRAFRSGLASDTAASTAWMHCSLGSTDFVEVDRLQHAEAASGGSGRRPQAFKQP